MVGGGIRIRQGDVADVKRLAELAKRTFAVTYTDLTEVEVERYVAEVLSVRCFKRALENGAVLFLASSDAGRDVGYAQMEATQPPTLLDATKPVELVRLFVDASYQQRGIGAALLGRAIGWARERGHDACWLRVWDQNPRAVAFYGSHGFDVFGDESYTAGGMADRVWLMQYYLR